jgi:hypothetical protein
MRVPSRIPRIPGPTPLDKQIGRDEFDYQTLLDVLRHYERPRDKISDLLRKGLIVRVKKGLYVFGDHHRSGAVSRHLLANLVYGPSCVSLDSALQHYGLIPEHVEAVTSVSVGRSRVFDTPVGRFIYRQIPPRAYPAGVSRIEEPDGNAFLMAVPEKALADKVYDSRNIDAATPGRIRHFLLDDLRVDEAGLARLNPVLLQEIADAYRSTKLQVLTQAINAMHRQKKGERA